MSRIELALTRLFATITEMKVHEGKVLYPLATGKKVRPWRQKKSDVQRHKEKDHAY